MWAIYKRELKSCFRSFIGFLFVAVTLFFLGLYFSVYNIMSGYPYFSYAISSVSFLFLISVPILTMRILAEEKHSKTDQLILTAPVSIGGVVMGKFLAMLTVFTVPVGIICLYPLVMGRYGTVPMGEAYLAVLGFFLYGMTAIATGIFVSSLTESQVIAAVLSFAVLFLGHMMSSICSIISGTGNVLTRILGCFDLYTPFSLLLNGTLDISTVVYYFSVTVLVLFLTVQSIQKRRYSMSAKGLSFSAYSTGMIAAAAAAAVILNMVMDEMPSSWTVVDMTSEKLYSLTEQTEQFVENMDEDVTIYVMVNEKDADTTLAQTLERYDDLSEHITVEYIDPAVNPNFHTQYTTENITINSMLVAGEKRSTVINYNNVYESSYDYTTYASTITGYDGEGQITSALDYVLSEDIPKVFFTEGHGEYSLSSTFTEAMDKENVDYETINLMDYDAVPEDAACLVINAAVKDFSVDDKDKVIDYLDQGGKVVLVTGYSQEETPNLDELLAYMGLQMAEGLVIEQNTDNYYQNPYYLLPAQTSHSYLSGLYGKYYVFAPFSQGIIITDEEAEGISYSTFLSTSDSAFSKVGTGDMEDYGKEEGDIDGPFAIGLEASKTLEEGEAAMMVYGCEQIFTDNVNLMVSGANLQMFINTISGFVEHEITVSVPVKNYEVSNIVMSGTDIIFWSVLSTVVLPLGCLIIGFVIWFGRRRR